MSGWQKFFLLFLSCIAVLICWPQYDTKGLTFMLMAFVLWTCIIILFSVLTNLFAIVKFEALHRLLSIVFLLVMIGSLLYYFPLMDGTTPFYRMKNNIWPSGEDIKTGINRMTFSVDLVHHNQPSPTPLKDTLQKANQIKKEMGQQIQKRKEALDIIVEGLEEDK